MIQNSIKTAMDIVIEMSEPILVDELINNHYHLIDDYITMPMNNISYLEDNKIINMQFSCKTSIFNDVFETINFIEYLRKDNFFMLFNINKTVDKKVSIRYIEIPLSYNLIGKEHIRTQRLRDKKIEEILK
jgi:hypothetical protein